MSQVSLSLLPSARCLFDEPVQVKVAGLSSGQVVAIRATTTDERGAVFKSSATYRADGKGEIDLNRDPSLGGGYIGLEPMGLLWSMRADALHQYFVKDVELKPLVVKFSVHEEEEEGKVLAEATNERLLTGDGVSRLPVKVGTEQGVLFTPPGPGPFFALLDINTYKSEKRASLLANKGFLVLALTVYTEKPSTVKEVHLDVFKEGVDFLLRHPKVGSKGIGVTSRSKSSDIALSLATFVPDVQVCVWINGCNANMYVPLYYKKRKILSPLLLDYSKVIHTESGACIVTSAYPNPLLGDNKGSLIPIEQAKARFLFVASEDDLVRDTKTYSDQMLERLKRHGKDNFERVCYPRSGHLLEPPYCPFCPSSPHGISNLKVMWGGVARFHAAAEVQLWKKIQEFLRTHLSCDDTGKMQDYIVE